MENMNFSPFFYSDDRNNYQQFDQGEFFRFHYRPFRLVMVGCSGRQHLFRYGTSSCFDCHDNRFGSGMLMKKTVRCGPDPAAGCGRPAAAV